MRVSRGAVGQHDCGLTRTSGTPGPLSIVRRRGWHVAHRHGIQTGDVNAKLHGRRAEQHRQSFGMFAELLLTPFTICGRDLSGVLLGADADQTGRGFAVQILEEGVHAQAPLVTSGAPDDILCRAQTIARRPAQDARVHSVSLVSV